MVKHKSSKHRATSINAPRRHWSAAVLLAASALSFPLAGLAADVATAMPKVRLTTTHGDIVVELNSAKAPKSVENFVQYVREKHYDGTVFHRVIETFMIQGGGFTADFEQKNTRAPVALEAVNGLKNDRGTIAMARTNNPNSATSQFFINVVNNDMLNAPSPDGYGYTVFGKVIEGMTVVDKIKAVKVGNKGPHQNVPQQPVTILKASLEK